MQPSPLQLVQLFYTNIAVKSRPLEAEQELESPFDFNGVIIGEGIDVAVLSEDKENPEEFALRLRIAITNAEGKQAPYDIDIEATAVFTVAPQFKREDRENFVVVNGCAVLYGAIRDQILTLTSRSTNGPLLLPTVNFLDRRRESTPDQHKELPPKKQRKPAAKKL